MEVTLVYLTQLLYGLMAIIYAADYTLYPILHLLLSGYIFIWYQIHAENILIFLQKSFTFTYNLFQEKDILKQCCLLYFDKW